MTHLAGLIAICVVAILVADVAVLLGLVFTRAVRRPPEVGRYGRVYAMWWRPDEYRAMRHIGRWHLVFALCVSPLSWNLGAGFSVESGAREGRPGFIATVCLGPFWFNLDGARLPRQIVVPAETVDWLFNRPDEQSGPLADIRPDPPSVAVH